MNTNLTPNDINSHYNLYTKPYLTNLRNKISQFYQTKIIMGCSSSQEEKLESNIRPKHRNKIEENPLLESVPFSISNASEVNEESNRLTKSEEKFERKKSILKHRTPTENIEVKNKMPKLPTIGFPIQEEDENNEQSSAHLINEVGSISKIKEINYAGSLINDGARSPKTPKVSAAKKFLKRKSTIRTSNFNGVTMVQNLEEYLPENLNREELKQMVFNALGNSIVEDMDQVVKGKTISINQAEALVDLVYDKVKKDKTDEKDAEGQVPIKKRRYSILNQVDVNIGFSDLTPDLLKKSLFQGKEYNEIQVQNIMKNLSQGSENVKVLTIELK